MDLPTRLRSSTRGHLRSAYSLGGAERVGDAATIQHRLGSAESDAGCHVRPKDHTRTRTLLFLRGFTTLHRLSNVTDDPAILSHPDVIRRDNKGVRVEADSVMLFLLLWTHTCCRTTERTAACAVKCRRSGIILTLLAVLPWLFVLAGDLPIHSDVTFTCGFGADQMHRLFVRLQEAEGTEIVSEFRSQKPDHLPLCRC